MVLKWKSDALNKVIDFYNKYMVSLLKNENMKSFMTHKKAI